VIVDGIREKEEGPTTLTLARNLLLETKPWSASQ
jgi:hypothetical protein